MTAESTIPGDAQVSISVRLPFDDRLALNHLAHVVEPNDHHTAEPSVNALLLSMIRTEFIRWVKHYEWVADVDLTAVQKAHLEELRRLIAKNYHEGMYGAPATYDEVTNY